MASMRGSGRVGASRGWSAACASDTASSTSSLRSFGFPRSTTRRPSLTSTPPHLTESWIAALLGRLSCLGFVVKHIGKEEGLAGLLSAGAYGRAH
ncbi:hypothetical protein BOTU111921_16000 [Bordetella tumbae]